MAERIPSKRLANGGDRAQMLANDLTTSIARGPEPTADQWAEAITASWQRAVASIIRTGRLLIEAKAKLRHGEWGPMVEKLPFSHRTANYLMAIAEHRVLSNSQFVANLPPCWATLSDLAGLPDEEVEAMIADGRINPGMERADAAEIIKEHREAGLYKFEDLAAAISTIAKFTTKWPEAAEVAERLDMEGDGTPDLDDLPKVSAWVSDLHTAMLAERARWEQLAEEEAEEEDRRIAAMPEDELREQARSRFPIDSSRAHAEAMRRNLPWAYQQRLPPKKRKRGRRPPPMFKPGRRADREQGECVCE